MCCAFPVKGAAYDLRRIFTDDKYKLLYTFDNTASIHNLIVLALMIRYVSQFGKIHSTGTN